MKKVVFLFDIFKKMSLYTYRVVFFVSSDRSSYSDDGLLYNMAGIYQGGYLELIRVTFFFNFEG